MSEKLKLFPNLRHPLPLLLVIACIGTIDLGRPPGGRAGWRAGEVQGHHRGAGPDLCRDVGILTTSFAFGC